MKKLTVLIFLLSFYGQSTTAQTTSEDSVKAVITQFFNGMKNVDTATIRATLLRGHFSNDCPNERRRNACQNRSR